MGLAIILPVNPEQNLYNIITIGPGSPPPRPHPQPPLDIWGPSDPRPTNPIAGWDPGTGTFPPGTTPPSPGPGTQAVVFPAPVTDPPTPPPEGMPPASKQYLIWFGPGTMPAMAWVAPYVSTGPVA